MRSPLYGVCERLYLKQKDEGILTAAVNRGWIKEEEKQEIIDAHA